MNQAFFADYILPFALAIITFGMGLSLKIQNFRDVLKFPKAAITGLLAQMILLPGIALLIAVFTNFDPVYKAGILLLAACPGGTASNLVTYLLRGRLALSLSMTAINSVLILFTIPIIVQIATSEFLGESMIIPPPIKNIMINIVYVVLIPTGLALFIRENSPKTAELISKWTKYILPVILGVVFSFVIYFEYQSNGANVEKYLPIVMATFLLNTISMAGGLGLSALLNLKKRNRFTIAIEVGLQNSALAIYIAETLLHNKEMAIVAVIYSSFTFFTTAGFGWLVKKYF